MLFPLSFKLRQSLGFMNGGKYFNALDFDNYHVFHKKINVITNFQFGAIEKYWYRDLCLYFQILVSQLLSQTSLVDTFQKSRTEVRMYLESGIKNHFAGLERNPSCLFGAFHRAHRVTVLSFV